MAVRRSLRTERELRSFGDNLARWRRLQGLTAAMVSERAGISRPTLRAIEKGEGSVRLENVFAVLRVLGQSGAVVEATEPLNSDLGRLNADRILPTRVRAPRTSA